VFCKFLVFARFREVCSLNVNLYIILVRAREKFNSKISRFPFLAFFSVYSLLFLPRKVHNKVAISLKLIAIIFGYVCMNE
jgi:hypothetical protein